MSKKTQETEVAVKWIWIHSPIDGSVYTDPMGKRIPYEGCKVPHTEFWQRRIKAGDVIKGKPKKK